MIRRHISLVALALATLAVAACSNPTAPSAKAPRVSHDAGVVQGSSI
ncbi:MAG: hypothetical protein ACJ79S_21885 [Gemmatimonadaceae bacterium]